MHEAECQQSALPSSPFNRATCGGTAARELCQPISRPRSAKLNLTSEHFFLDRSSTWSPASSQTASHARLKCKEAVVWAPRSQKHLEFLAFWSLAAESCEVGKCLAPPPFRPSSRVCELEASPRILQEGHKRGLPSGLDRWFRGRRGLPADPLSARAACDLYR